MKVVVPYTKLSLSTEKALDDTGVLWDAFGMWGEDTYWALLNRLWEAGDTFIIVEHDIIVHKDVIKTFANCTDKWCGFRYPYLNGENLGLGCVKFDRTLIAAVPDALKRVGEMSDDTHPAKHWCRLDAWLTTVLRDAGFTQSCHYPPVEHLSIKSSHGCIT